MVNLWKYHLNAIYRVQNTPYKKQKLLDSYFQLEIVKFKSQVKKIWMM